MYLLSGRKDFIDFDVYAGNPPWKYGRIFWDNVNHCLAIYDDKPETTLQVGQEIRVHVQNTTAETIINGAAVTVIGVTPEGVVEVGLAIASDEISARNMIGIATMDIPPDDHGWATTAGFVNDVDTSMYTDGAAIWLSDTEPGAYTEVRPLSPSFEVRMGGIARSGVTDGIIYAELRIMDAHHDNNAFFNGSILEPNRVDIVSNGTTVNLSLRSEAANNRLSLIISQEYISVTDGININLILGTDTVPVENWVYVDIAGDMQISTSGFPTSVQYTPVARAIVPSAATAQTYGLYKLHAYTDHLSDSAGPTGGQGHLSHLNSWVRKRPAAYVSGLVLTQSVPEETPAARIDLSYTSGVIAQLHDHNFPAYDTATRAAFIINDYTTPYYANGGINPDIDTDSEGDSIGNNKYYNLVIWGVVSEETKDCKLFFNLPSGSYTNITDAVNDIKNTALYSIPGEYLGTGFLLTKLVVRRTGSTVEITAGATEDLRGTISSIGGGSVLGGEGITKFDQLTDTPITKVGQATKHIRVNAAEDALEYWAPANHYTEIPTGDIDGANKQFTVTKVFIEDSTSVYLNGLKQIIGADYTEDGGFESITFVDYAPKTIGFTDIIEIVFQSIE